MTASAPSNTAVATSETSARVGTGSTIIDLSIWVATTTGLPDNLAARVNRFCQPGTSSSGSSTPRSPRATMMLSQASMMALISLSAAGFSTFTMRPARPRDQPPRLGHVLGPLDEGLGDPVDPEPGRRIRDRHWSFSVSGAERQDHIGNIDALAGRQRAAEYHLGGEPLRRDLGDLDAAPARH